MQDTEFTVIEKDLMAAVSEDQLMEFNRNIAKEVRLSGSQEEARAVTYLQEQLNSFGVATKLMHSTAYISLPGPASMKVNGQECGLHPRNDYFSGMGQPHAGKL